MNIRKKDTSLVAHVSSEDLALIREAADLSGSTLSQFMVEAITTKAKNVLREMKKMTSIQLSLQGSKDIFNLIENPPPISRQLAAKAATFNRRQSFKENKHKS